MWTSPSRPSLCRPTAPLLRGLASLGPVGGKAWLSGCRAKTGPCWGGGAQPTGATRCGARGQPSPSSGSETARRPLVSAVSQQGDPPQAAVRTQWVPITAQGAPGTGVDARRPTVRTAHPLHTFGERANARKKTPRPLPLGRRCRFVPSGWAGDAFTMVCSLGTEWGS